MRYVPEHPINEFSHVYLHPRVDQDGRKWIRARIGDQRSQFQPLTNFRGRGKKALPLLDQAGFNLSQDQFEEMVEKVGSITKFKSAQRIDHPGWNTVAFTFRDGCVVDDGGDLQTVISFVPEPKDSCAKGTHEKWLEAVAEPLTGHPLPEFCLMLALTGPLLRFSPAPFNFGFELSGAPGTGKTTLNKVCASVSGPSGGPLGNHIVTMNATTNALDEIMPQYNDRALLLEEMNLATLGSARGADKKIAELIFKLAEGRPKRRQGRQVASDARFVWLSTTNTAWPDIARAMSADIALAVADRHISLPVPKVEAGGVFAREKLDEDGVAGLAGKLARGLSQQYGSALPKFVEYLVKQVSQRGDLRIRQEVQTLVDDFAAKVAAKDIEAGERLVTVFGIVYAAGTLAQRAEVLPRSYRPGMAAGGALRRHLDCRARIRSPMEVLRDLANNGKALDIRASGYARTAQEVDAATCVLREGRYGDELVITANQLARLDVDPRQLFSDPEVNACILREAEKRIVYRNLAPATRTYVYCFRLTGILRS